MIAQHTGKLQSPLQVRPTLAWVVCYHYHPTCCIRGFLNLCLQFLLKFTPIHAHLWIYVHAHQWCSPRYFSPMYLYIALCRYTMVPDSTILLYHRIHNTGIHRTYTTCIAHIMWGNPATLKKISCIVPSPHSGVSCLWCSVAQSCWTSPTFAPSVVALQLATYTEEALCHLRAVTVL